MLGSRTETVVQLLLENGVDANAQGGRHSNALQAASTGGHEPVVQLLLEKGADVNTQRGFIGTSIHAASAGGHEMVALLSMAKEKSMAMHLSKLSFSK